jgi:hypothetical protein
LTATFVATTPTATPIGKDRRHASTTIAIPATTSCATGESTPGLNTASAAVSATKAAAIAMSTLGRTGSRMRRP